MDGAPESDHVLAKGVDLDFETSDHRRRAERWVKSQRQDNPWLEMSLGLGGRTIHVGLLTERGERTWHYNSYTE